MLNVQKKLEDLTKNINPLNAEQEKERIKIISSNEKKSIKTQEKILDNQSNKINVSKLDIAKKILNANLQIVKKRIY